MSSGVNELAAELLSVVFYGAISSILAYGSVLSELSAVEQFGAGEMGLALWYLFIGVLAFYGGVALVRDKLWPSLRAISS